MTSYMYKTKNENFNQQAPVTAITCIMLRHASMNSRENLQVRAGAPPDIAETINLDIKHLSDMKNTTVLTYLKLV
jgi:hypothetical protein